MAKSSGGFVKGSEFAARMGKRGADVCMARGNRRLWTLEEAKAAGRKGGQTRVANEKARLARGS